MIKLLSAEKIGTTTIDDTNTANRRNILCTKGKKAGFKLFSLLNLLNINFPLNGYFNFDNVFFNKSERFN